MASLFLLNALQYVGIPYKYGGQSPPEGLDCSALSRILLKAGGIALDSSHNAQRLYDVFQAHPTPSACLGDLVFYGDSPSSISHVAMALSAHVHVEAAGGDSSTNTLADSIARRAFVRVTPIRITQRVGIFRPPYPFVVDE